MNAVADATNSDADVDVEFSLTAAESTISILPGKETTVWRYTGEVLKGDPLALQHLSDAYLGPILRLHKGQKVRIHFQNELSEASIIHWHGLLVPAEMDGHPKYAVGPGESYIYEFEVKNQAGTYWFHPHSHGRAGEQTYKGLAGLFLVMDEDEQALDLPAGEYELPLVLQDRIFDAENQFVYQAETGGASGTMGGMNHGNMGGGMDDMMTQMMGQLGDRILVNGHLDATLEVATRVYRLRLLNGSNARIYKLAWADGAPLTVIGTDDGLLERPVQKEYVTLAPGARVDLWADFSQDAVGTERKLRSLSFSGVEMGEMMGMMESSSLTQGIDLPILTAHVVREEAEERTLPERLVAFEKLDPTAAKNSDNPRRIELSMQNMQWTLNGRSFEMDAVAADEHAQLNELELWEFVNVPGQGMMADFMAHPMHIHGVHFQVVERQVDPAYLAGWDSVSAGYVDEGWRDTVLVMPGERVRVLLRFSEPGTFLYHCHNLEHEDGGMMRNILVA
ncbi:MAG: multicopper oxidase family protein [Caldilineaceae bacterium]|nr:multicopper oxidase family protein [Caldilineaceae bacterium]MCB0138656.1 multicopper oxidase family protein [Caldilineaceae bacterium]